MPTAVITPVDVGAIKATAKPWVEACLARDWDALLALCTDDVVFLPPDEPIVIGKQVRAWLENYPVIRSFTVEFDRVEGQENLAAARGHFTMTLELPGSAAPLTVDGKFVDSFRKDPDGTWRYATVIWNSSLPSPLRGAVPVASAASASPLQATSLSPGLTVNDLAQSIRFFEGLGFVVADRWEQDGKLQGVMLQAGSVHIGLSQDDWQKGKDRVKGVGTRTSIETRQNVDEIAERARAAGVVLSREPHDTPWGTRAFEVTTAEGFVLTIHS